LLFALMRAAPALQVTVSGRGAWRWLVVALAAASTAASAWWLLSRLGGATGSAAFAVCIASALAASIAGRAVRQPPRHLRFDGQHWQLGMAAGADGQTRSGDLTVVMDLGPWMLLRFDAPADGTHGRCRHWLALGRDELQAQWHALRCAVYSPRPDAPSGSREAPVDPPSRE
jgi:hypothetical protein